MDLKVDKTMSKGERAKEIKILETKLSVTEQVLEKEQAKMRELVKFGGALLYFAAQAGSAISDLDSDSAGKYIAECYLSLAKDLQELDRLDELETAVKDEREELMKLIADEDLVCFGPSPIAWVIGRKMEVDVFEED